MRHPTTHIFALDADGSLYNLKYLKLILEIMNRHWEFLETFGRKPHFLDVDIEALKNKTDAIIAELYTIEFDEEDVTTLTSGITNTQFVKKIEAVCLEQIENNIKPTLSTLLPPIMSEFLQYMDRLDKEIVPNIFLAANKELIAHLCNKMEINEIERFALVLASNRQSLYTDLAGMRQNGTRSIYLDLYDMQQAMERLSKRICMVSQFCMADIYGRKKRGESFRNILNEHFFNSDVNEFYFDHASSIFDERKFSLIYAIAHDAVIHILEELKIPDKDADIELDFYDDRLDILLPLAEKFTQYPELLPTNVRLNLFHYDGKLQMSPIASIQGKGVVDYNYRTNVRRMAKMCGYSEVIDTVSQLDIPQFLAARITGRELMPYKANNYTNLFQPKSAKDNQVNADASSDVTLRPG